MAERASSRSRMPVLVVMCAGYFLVLLDVTIVNVALPSIASGVGAGVAGLQWVVDGYALALACLMLAGGTLGDLRGHRRVVLSGLVVFGLGSLACGLAPGVEVLVGARVVQGIGAACLLPGTLAIISRAFPRPGEQARAIGVWAAVGSAALPAGPLLGGTLIATVGWRAVFLVNVPVVIVALVAAIRLVEETTAQEDRRLDVPGVVLGALALGLATFAFVQGGHAGIGAPVVVAGVLTGAALVAFIGIERRAADPMLPLGLLRRPGFAVANAVAGAMNLGTLGLLFVLTLYLQSVQHRSALGAGLALIPLFLPLSVLAPFTGRLTARIGPRVPMAAGLVIAGTGVALLTTLDPGSSYLTLLPGLLLWGIGLGLLTPAVVAAAIASVPGDRAGLASATNNTARQAGGAIGIAAFGALAGSAADRTGFIAGLHIAVLITVGLWLLAIAATLALAPRAHS